MRTSSVLRLSGAVVLAVTMSAGFTQPASAFSQEASDNIAEFFRCKALMFSDFAKFRAQCGGTPDMSDLKSMASGQGTVQERKRHECYDYKYETGT